MKFKGRETISKLKVKATICWRSLLSLQVKIVFIDMKNFYCAMKRGQQTQNEKVNATYGLQE